MANIFSRFGSKIKSTVTGAADIFAGSAIGRGILSGLGKTATISDFIVPRPTTPKDAQVFPIGAGLTPEQKAQAAIKLTPSSLGLGPDTLLTPEAQARISDPTTPAAQRIATQTQQPFIQAAQPTPLAPTLTPPGVPFSPAFTASENVRIREEIKQAEIQRQREIEAERARLAEIERLRVLDIRTFGGSGIVDPVTGVVKVSGGAAALPGSIGFGPFRTGGRFDFPTTEEEKKRRADIINRNNLSFNVNNLFDIPTAQASMGMEAPTKGQQQPQPQPGGFVPLIERLFGQPRVPFVGPETANLGPLVDPNRPDLGRVSLSNQQQDIINNIVSGPEVIGEKTGDLFAEVTGQEFSRAMTRDITDTQVRPEDTVESTREKIAIRAADALGVINSVDQNLINDAQQSANQTALTQTLQKSGGYVKVTDPTSGQINVAKINPSTGEAVPVTQEQFQAANLNIDLIPDVEQFGADYTNTLNDVLSQTIDTVTGRPYTAEDLEVPTEDNALTKALKDIQDDIEEFSRKLNLDFDEEEARRLIVKEEGLPTLRSQKTTLQENINGILGVYEELADEIRNDPDFSRKLKSRRLQFLSTEQSRALVGFQRQLEIVEDEIKTATDTVNTRMKDRINTYNIQFNQLKQLEAQEERIRNQINKATDDGRQLLTTFLTQFGGASWEDLPKETQDTVKAEFKRLNAPHLVSILQAGLATQKDKALLLQAQSVANRTPVNVNFTIPGLGLFSGRDIPTPPAGFQTLEKDQLSRLRGAGIPETVYNGITNAILQNESLDAIRLDLDALKTQGVFEGTPWQDDPRAILDKYDEIVNISSVTSGRRFITPGSSDQELLLEGIRGLVEGINQ